MIVEAFRPKEMLLEFEKVKAEARLLVVPALTLMLPWLLATVIVAVSVLPFRPKLMLFELEKTTVPEEASVVPAEIAEGPVDCE